LKKEARRDFISYTPKHILHTQKPTCISYIRQEKEVREEFSTSKKGKGNGIYEK